MIYLKKKPSRFSVLSLSIFIVFVIWIYDFLLFVKKIPLHEPNLKLHSEAIVVLTGGSGRIKKGLSLLKEGFSDKLFISGVNPNFQLKNILKSF